MPRNIELLLNRIGVTATCPRFIQHEDPITLSLLQSFQTLVAGEKQDPVVVEYPANWIEALKDRFLPQWAKRRWLVLYEKKEFSIKTIYPFLKSKLPLDMMGDRVLIVVNDKPIGAFLTDTDGLMPNEWIGEVSTLIKNRSVTDYDKCPFCHRAWFERRKY